MLVNKLWGEICLFKTKGGKSVILKQTTQIINLGSLHGYSGRSRRVNSPYMLVGRPALKCLQKCKHLILLAFCSFRGRKNVKLLTYKGYIWTD